ncbi:MAG: hypothetical protein LBS19_07465 [Clostridiales bacterium]|jgi:hypothetical protein|nr:hypothetical protein [Clostridiales bacterium]
MKTKELPVLSVVLYILAAITAIMTGFIWYQVFTDISSALSQGALVLSNDWQMLVSHVMREACSYLAYPILFLAAGRILQYVSTPARGDYSGEWAADRPDQISITKAISRNNVAEDDDEDE